MAHIDFEFSTVTRADDGSIVIAVSEKHDGESVALLRGSADAARNLAWGIVDLLMRDKENASR